MEERQLEADWLRFRDPSPRLDVAGCDESSVDERQERRCESARMLREARKRSRCAETRIYDRYGLCDGESFSDGRTGGTRTNGHGHFLRSDRKQLPAQKLLAQRAKEVRLKTLGEDVGQLLRRFDFDDAEGVVGLDDGAEPVIFHCKMLRPSGDAGKGQIGQREGAGVVFVDGGAERG